MAIFLKMTVLTVNLSHIVMQEMIVVLVAVEHTLANVENVVIMESIFQNNKLSGVLNAIANALVMVRESRARMSKCKFNKSELNTIEFLIGDKVVVIKSLQKRFAYNMDEPVAHLEKLLDKVRKM